MIVNATLLRIDTPAGATTGGKVTYTPGSAIAVRCGLGGLSAKQQHAAEALKVTVTLSLSVLASALPAGVTLEANQRLTVKYDGDAGSRTYRAENVSRNVKGAISNYQVLLREE